MRMLSRRWIRSTVLFVAMIASGGLMAAQSCNVTIQFDAFDLLFGSADLLESPS